MFFCISWDSGQQRCVSGGRTGPPDHCAQINTQINTLDDHHDDWDDENRDNHDGDDHSLYRKQEGCGGFGCHHRKVLLLLENNVIGALHYFEFWQTSSWSWGWVLWRPWKRGQLVPRIGSVQKLLACVLSISAAHPHISHDILEPIKSVPWRLGWYPA